MFEVKDLYDLTLPGAFASAEEWVQFSSSASPEDLYGLLQDGAFSSVEEFQQQVNFGASPLKKKEDTVSVLEDGSSDLQEPSVQVEEEQIDFDPTAGITALEETGVLPTQAQRDFTQEPLGPVQKVPTKEEQIEVVNKYLSPERETGEMDALVKRRRSSMTSKLKPVLTQEGLEKNQKDSQVKYIIESLDEADRLNVVANLASIDGEITDEQLSQLKSKADANITSKYGEEEMSLLNKITGGVDAKDVFNKSIRSTNKSIIDDLVVEGDETATVANLNNEFAGTPFSFSEAIIGSDAVEVSVLDVSGVPINSKIVRIDDAIKGSQKLKDFMAKANLSKGNKEFLQGKINGKDISNLPMDQKRLANYKYMLENKDKFSAGKGVGFSINADAIMRFVNENPGFFPPEELQSIKLQLDAALAGQYKEDKELEGSFFGSLGESFLKGATQTSKFTTNLGIDIGGALMPSMFMPSNSFSAINFDENGNRLSDSEVIDKVKKEGKREMIAAMDNAVESSFTGTTQAWMNSEERNDLAKALNFVFESLGVVASVGANKLALTPAAAKTLNGLAFFAYAANGIEDEMAGTEYDELSEWKKKLISFPYGVMIGALENLGWEASTGAFGNKVFDKISKGIISRAMKSVPKNASEKVIKTAIENSTKAAIADGTIKIISGALSEGLVEGTQEFGDVGLKNVVNLIMDKDYFADAPDLSTKEGWLETIKQAKESGYYGLLAGGSSAGGGGIIQGTKKRLQRDADIREYNEKKQAHTNKTQREKLIFNINNAQRQGQMTAEQAEAAKEQVLEDAATYEQIPDEGLSNKNKLESFDLITERNNLEKEIAGKNEELVTKQRDRIRDINAQLTIIGTQDATTEQEASGLDEDQQARNVQQMEEGTPQPEPKQTTAEEVEVKEELKPTEEQREKLEKQAVRELKKENRKTRREGFKGDKIKGTRKKYEPTQEEIDARVDELFQAQQQEDQEVLDLEAAIEGEVKEGRALPSETTAVEEVTTEEAPVAETVVEEVETGKREVEEYFKALEERRKKSEIERKLFFEYDDSPKSSKERRELKKKLIEAQRDKNEADKVLQEKESVITNKFPNLKEAYQKKEEADSEEWYDASKEYYDAFNETINNILNQEAPVAETAVEEEVTTEEAPLVNPKVDGVVMSDKKRNKKEQALVDRAKRAAKALTRIGKGGVTIELHDDTDSFKKVTGQDGRGAYDKTSNTIHINLSKANNTTVAHEAFHAVLLQRVSNTAEVTKTMFDAVRKAGKGDTRVMEYTTTKEVDGKTETVTKTATVEEYLEDFASKYEENIQDEEKLAELTGLLASSYVNLAPAPKSKVRQWVEKVMTPIAEKLGIKVDQFTKTDQGVVDLLNAISAKVTIGEEIQEGDVKVLEEIETKEEYSESADVLKEYNNNEIAEITRNSNNNAEEFLGKLISKETKKVEGGSIEQEVYQYGIIQRIFANDGSKIQRLTDYSGKVYGTPIINLTMDSMESGLLFGGKKDFSLSEKEITYFFNSKFKPVQEIETKPETKKKGKAKKINWTKSEGKRPKRQTTGTEMGKVVRSYEAGEITLEEYNKKADELMPTRMKEKFTEPATNPELGKLRGQKKAKINAPIKEGADVGLRLDIPLMEDTGVSAVTIHPGRGLTSSASSYRGAAVISDVEFKSNPKSSLGLASEATTKNPTIARMAGSFVNIGETIEEQNEAAKKLAQQAMNEGWTQVGVNPSKHSYFYDRSNGKPLKSADRVVQVGDLIYAENAKTTTIYDDRFIVKGKTDKKGGPLRFQKANQDIEFGRLTNPTRISVAGKDISNLIFLQGLGNTSVIDDYIRRYKDIIKISNSRRFNKSEKLQTDYLRSELTKRIDLTIKRLQKEIEFNKSKLVDKDGDVSPLRSEKIKDAQVRVELLDEIKNTISENLFSPSDLEITTEPEEQGEGGEVGTIRLQKANIQFKPAPGIGTDTRSFAKFYEEKSLRDFNGKKFVTNMYDFTNAGEVDLGNGYVINLWGGKSYVPYMLEKRGKNLGEVSNLAAFNTEEQAETFIRNSKEENASLFIPHSGTTKGSWQFQQSIFQELTNLALDKKILSKKQLISLFNESIKSDKGKKAFKTFVKNYNQKREKEKKKPKNIKDFNSFITNPKEIIELLDIENNMSPDLRKIFNSKYSTNEAFKEALGVKNSIDFALKMEDPLNNGISGGDLMGIIEFDNTSFKIRKPNKNDPDYHPSFAYTVEAKINGVYQPTEFYKSNEVTDSYTKNNKDGAKVSRKTDFTLEEYELAKKGIAINDEGKKVKRKPFKGTLEEFQEMKFEKSNVSSSAGSIPKVAELSETAMREQKSLMQIGRYYNANNQGFFPVQVNAYQLKQDLEQIGFGLKRAVNGAYYATRNGRKVNPFPPEPSRYRRQRDDIGIVEEKSFTSKNTVADIIIAARREGFKDKAIRFYILKRRSDIKEENGKPLRAKTVDDMLRVPANILENVPDSFKEIEGGAAAGLRLYQKVEQLRDKLLAANARIKSPKLSDAGIKQKIKEKREELKKKKLSDEQLAKELDAFTKREYKNNKARKEMKTESEIMDEVIEFLEKQPEYIEAGDKGKKTPSLLQSKMQAELQATIAFRPSREVAQNLSKLKNRARAMEKAGRDLQEIKRQLRATLRKSLPKTEYSKPEVMRLLGEIAKVDASNLQDVIGEIESFIVKKNVQILEAQIDKLLGTKVTKSEAGRRKGKFGYDEAARLEAINNNIVKDKKVDGKVVKYTAEEIMDKNERLRRELNEIMRQPELSSENINKLTDLQIAININSANLMKAQLGTKERISPNIIAPLVTAQESLQELIEEGRSKFKVELQEAHQKYQEQFTMLWEEITGEKIDMSDPDVRDKINARLKESSRISKAEKAKNRGKFRNVLTNMYDSLVRGLNKAEDLSGLMNKISIMPGELAGGRIQEMITDRVDESTRVYKGRMMIQEDVIENKMEEIFGRKWRKRAVQLNDTKTNGITLETKDEVQTISQNQLAYLYNQYKDPANAGSFKAMFGENYEQEMSKLISQLDPQLKEWADWQVDEFFPSVYEYYNDAYKKIYRTDMPWNQFYAGRIYREGFEQEPLDMLANSSIFQTSVGAASTLERKVNNLPIQAMNINNALTSYIQDMEYFAAHAETVRDIDKMFTNKDVRKYLKNIYGDDINNLIDSMIKKVSAKGQQKFKMASFINKSMNAFIISKLAFNPVVFIKQLTSIPTYANDIGIANWIKYSKLGSTLSQRRSAIMEDYNEVIKNSVYLQDRAKGLNIRNAIAHYEDHSNSIIDKSFGAEAQRIAMMLTKSGDKAAIMLGGLPNYRYYKAQYKKQNPKATEQEVIDYAIRKFERDTKKTQQSSDIQDRDYYQTDDPLMRSFNMFMTTPKQYLRKEIDAFRNLGRKIKSLDKKKSLKENIKSFKETGKGTVGQNLRQLAMYHVMMPALFQWAALGFPVDMDDEDKADMAGAMLLGNLNALFIVGDLFTMTKDVLLEKPWGGTPETLSIMQWASSVLRKWSKWQQKIDAKKPDPTKIDDARYDFYGTILEGAGIPARQGMRYYDNYTKLFTEKMDTPEKIRRILNYSDYTIEGKKDDKKKGSGMSSGVSSGMSSN